MELVEMFNEGAIDALVAIRCLDEGINIPSITGALILASNDDYREFVQRRGRILRTYKGKAFANIYDVIVLPSHDMQGWAKIELRRFREYARLALNWSDLTQELDAHLMSYGLTEEDMCVVIDKFLDIVDTLNANKEKQKEYCRTEAYQYLRISRSSFDAKVNNGVLPKGHKLPGKGPVWYKKDLDEYLKKYDNKKKASSTDI